MMERLDVRRYRRLLLFRYVMRIIAIGVCVLLTIWGKFVSERNTGELLISLTITIFTAMSIKVAFLPEDISVWQCMKSDLALERAWYEEHDELKWQMRAKAGMPIIQMTALALELLFLGLQAFRYSKAYIGILICAIFVGVSYVAYHVQILRCRIDEEETNDEP